MRASLLKTVLPLTVAVHVGAVAHAEPQLQLSAGAFFSTGDFDGTESTDVTVAPFSARLSQGPWSLRATVPYVSLRGPANVAVVVDDDSGGGGGSNSGSDSGSRRGSGSGSGSGGSGSGSGGSGSGRGGGSDDPTPPPGMSVANTSQTDSGIGDASLAATYSFDQLGSSSAYLDLTGRVRLPTGDEDRGLGVGATDYAFIGELGWETTTGGSYLSVGRRLLGSVTGLDRQDGWQYGLGAWFDASDSIVLGAFYERRDASVRGAEDPSEAGLYITKAVTRSLKIELSGSAGLSDANSDYEVGLTLIWKSLDRAR